MIAETATRTDFDPAVNMARQSLYRFAAVSLLDPKAGSWQQLDALRGNSLPVDAAALIGELSDAVPRNLERGERPLADLDPGRVLERLPATPQALNKEFENTFGLLVSNACPPYEMEYINSKFTFQRSNTLADIGGYYRAFGLTLGDEHPERPDHVVLELEFMAQLVALERRAAQSDDDVAMSREVVCRDAQKRFLQEHLAWWTPAFARLLSKENPDGFYEVAGTFLSALVPAERGLLGVVASTRGAAPSTLERPEDCEGCLLATQ
jgi:TorA maturation chaperone TorD